MPPEEIPTADTTQAVPESSAPVVEESALDLVPSAPELTPASTEASPAPETGPQGPLPVSKTDDRQETQVAQSTTPTAQIPPNEPLPPEPEPIEPEPEPEPIQPPSAAAPAPTGILNSARDVLNKARISIQDRKRKKRDKVMEALAKKNKITNDEVEKLLHVSDATATRYLSALEKENKIKQVGKTGTAVVYQKI